VQRDAGNPSQHHVDTVDVVFAFHDAGKAVVPESAKHRQLLSRFAAPRERTKLKIVTSQSCVRTVGQIRLMEGVPDGLQQKVIPVTYATFLQVGAALSTDPDGPR
jgi:hypothetical protein